MFRLHFGDRQIVGLEMLALDAILFLFALPAFTAGSTLPSCWPDLRGFERCHCDIGSGDSCRRVAQTSNCSALHRCPAIKGTGCGWCWDSLRTANAGQRVGGRPGTAQGPADGGECDDWTFYSSKCASHVDCFGDVPTCSGILGTYCGWCAAGEDDRYSHRALRGTADGPLDNRIKCDHWIWKHEECNATKGGVAAAQVHLSLAGTNGDRYAITFSSYGNGTRQHATVTLSCSGNDAAISIPATPTHFNNTNSGGAPWVWRALFPSTGLCPAGSTLHYRVDVSGADSIFTGTDHNYTMVYARDPSDPAETRPLSYLIYGDLGRFGGGQILRAVKREMAGVGVTSAPGTPFHLHPPDGVFHIGDFAYNLYDNSGLNGDAAIQRISVEVASVAPYMTCPGNHEIQTKGCGENKSEYFVQYRNRFTMPRGMGSGATDGSDAGGRDMWYSYDHGLLHMVSFSTEIFFAACETTQTRMLQWLEKDLASVNRSQTPWVVTFGHRPQYCSNDVSDDCTRDDSLVRAAVESLFHAHLVDVSFSGHEHSYERMFPMWNGTATNYFPQSCVDDVGCVGTTVYRRPSAPIQIVLGVAGCNEHSSVCTNPIRRHRANWSAFYLQTPGTYSYGRLTVLNATALQWSVVIAEEERVVDDVIVLKSSRY